ncbi:S-layer homology domain-containing protein [Peptoniphilus sp. KCTC 25270]|uniref:S-layer homology domain-containing protein n=1 Tax=Peptoniphilus sp. KCTC 25270 TaxID=2897414 RepID=UPI001E652E91|nr:S-layer homology domain-containing protein [Peptoniphilus sp. KCTC 25270]MCD1148032.1 S-layer homology domain-containing protein [Peptoniphilus sp. KCTC 25270]
MNKKFLSLVLALVMVLGAFTSVFAADAVDTKEVPKLTSNDAKIQWLVDNEIVIGRKVNEKAEDNDLALTETIQRAEVTKLLVYAIGKADLAEKLFGLVNPYSDVAKDYWANGYITVGTTSVADNGLAFLNGYPDGTFKPMNNVTYAELAKMLVVLADDELTQAQHDAYNANWPTAWVVKATEMGIFEGITNVNANDDVIRSNGFVMMFNAFYAMKDIRVIPVNETIGVISKKSDGTTLTLNQGDFLKEFKVDENTVFVGEDLKEASQKWLSQETKAADYFVGSLVRVLVQDDVVTHIVELGRPAGVVEADRNAWTGIIADDGYITNMSSLDKENETVKGYRGDANLTSKTRYFVADYNENALTEVKDFDAAMDLVDELLPNVEGYFAYNVLPNSGVKEAKVVVFSEVNTKDTDATLVRVNAPVTNGSFNLPAQAPGLTETAVVNYDLRNVTSIFPYNYNVEKYDVLKIVADKDNKVTDVPKQEELVIDYSVDNIYKVVEINKGTVDALPTTPAQQVNEMVLVDAAGNRARVDLPTDYDAFFTDGIKVGAFVQLTVEATDKGVLADIVSVVPATKVRGEFTADFNNVEKVTDTVTFIYKGEYTKNTAEHDYLYTAKIYVVDADGVASATPTTVNTNNPDLKAGNTYEGQLFVQDVAGAVPVLADKATLVK